MEVDSEDDNSSGSSSYEDRSGDLVTGDHHTPPRSARGSKNSDAGSSITPVSDNTISPIDNDQSPKKRIAGSTGDLYERPAKKSKTTHSILREEFPEPVAVLPQGPANTYIDFQKAEANLTVLPKNINACIAQVGSTLQIAQQKIAALERELQAKKQEVSADQALCDAKNKIALLEKQLKAQRKDSQEMAEDYEERIAQSLGIKKQLQELLKEKDKKHSELRAICDSFRRDVVELEEANRHDEDENYRKISDDQIERSWKGLAFTIQDFVFQTLTRDPHGVVSPKGSTDGVVKPLRVAYKRNPAMSCFHYQKAIWDRIHYNIFQPGAKVWGGRAGQIFHRFCLDVAVTDFDDKENFSRFKAKAAQSLEKAFDDKNRKAVLQIIESLQKDLFIFTNPDCTAEHVKKKLTDIVDRALKLNMGFLKSKAFFVASLLPQQYDGEDVDVRYTCGDPERVLELGVRISPMIHKIGVADGHDFHQKLVICKPLVTMVEP
ncbi:hypothetical protein FZEAL_10640 [Fusarium zealandicum]|uniref:Uncharacterized protein n=1 Tax=Fusarium zealandicum TaxID=1053134 RepID=A0A8H4TYL6_9HYPO|nr:hypothetical protein FZEAL_10640 [Fusarium zealandicum]